MEKRHNYVRKVAEVAVTLFISSDRPNVAGLVLAGSADFKTELSQSDMFDPVSSFCIYLSDVNELFHFQGSTTLTGIRHWPTGLHGLEEFKYYESL